MENEAKHKGGFDFDGSSLRKSPCRGCAFKRYLPDCSNNCLKLSQLQMILIGDISCANNFSEYETHSVRETYFSRIE